MYYGDGGNSLFGARKLRCQWFCAANEYTGGEYSVTRERATVTVERGRGRFFSRLVSLEKGRE